MTAAALTFPRYAEPARTRPAPRRALLEVVVSGRRLRRRRRNVTLAATATVLTLLTVVAFNVVLAQSQLSIDRLDQKTTNAQQRYEDLRLQYDNLSSPARIIARAERLGLVAAARPPTAVPTAGALPPTPAVSSTTLQGYSDVKSTLATSP